MLRNNEPVYEHRVNMVYARLSCTECMDSGIDDEENAEKDEFGNPKMNLECELCGPNQGWETRSICWSSMLVDENGEPLTGVDHIDHKGQKFQAVYSNNPLRSFMEWLKNLPNKHESICFAHNGGK